MDHTIFSDIIRKLGMCIGMSQGLIYWDPKYHERSHLKDGLQNIADELNSVINILISEQEKFYETD